MVVSLVVAAVVLLVVVAVVGYDLYASNRLKRRLGRDGYVRGDGSVPGTDAALGTAQVEGHTHGMGNGYAG